MSYLPPKLWYHKELGLSNPWALYSFSPVSVFSIHKIEIKVELNS